MGKTYTTLDKGLVVLVNKRNMKEGHVWIGAKWPINMWKDFNHNNNQRNENKQKTVFFIYLAKI